MDAAIKFKQQDLIVVLVCDGYDAVGQAFKDKATKFGFYDQEKLINRGFMKKDARSGKWTMKTMPELMDKSVPEDQIPTNMLHCFQVCTWDFGFGKNED
jgi:cellulose synthase/poly-beta-1,6-N-acetylglucosamine synthase-like glycosyltransferase